MSKHEAGGEREPAQPISEERGKRLGHLMQSARMLFSSGAARIETDHAGFQLSIQDGVSMYLHVGTENLSVTQEIDFMTSDDILAISFQPHSISDSEPGPLAGSIYKIGKREVRVTRNGARIHATPEELAELPDEPADDTEVLRLSVFMGRALNRLRKNDTDE